MVEVRAYPVDGEEQALQLRELSGGDAEQARRVVEHGTSSTLVPGQRVYRTRADSVSTTRGAAQ